MKKPDFKNSLVRARNSIKESQDVRSMYHDDAVNEDIAGLSDLIGIVKGFAPNWQAIASAVGGAIKGGWKNFWKEVADYTRGDLEKHFANLDREKSSIIRAKKIGVPEILVGAPASFWCLEVFEREHKRREYMALLDKYSAESNQFSEDNKNFYDILHKSIIGESHTRDAALIIEKWERALLTEAAVDDYNGKEIPRWVSNAVKRARGNPTVKNAITDATVAGDLADDDWLSKLTISVILSDNERIDPEDLLKTIYEEDPGENQKKNQQDLSKAIERKYLPRIVAMHALLLSREDAYVPAKDGINDVFPGRLTGTLTKLWDQSQDALKNWERGHRKADADLDDIEAFAEFLKGAGGMGDFSDEPEDLRSKLNITSTDDELFLDILTSLEWLNLVAQKESSGAAKSLKAIIADIQAYLGEEMAEGLKPAKTSDLNAAQPLFKKGFEVFSQQDDIKEAYELAIEEQDDEIMSRIIAQFRPSYVESFVDSLDEKSFKDMISPNFDAYESLVKKSGYDSSKDPMWEQMVTILFEDGYETVVKGLESGLDVLESEREKAKNEMVEIMEKKKEEAEEEQAEEEDVDLDLAT
tara:strand:+ start:1646 stop:3400 length:1755 start_codon:yes stop_codon:yes gene_type:complete